MSIPRPPFVGWLVRNEARHAWILFVPKHDGWDKIVPSKRQNTILSHGRHVCPFHSNVVFGDRFFCIRHTTTANMHWCLNVTSILHSITMAFSIVMPDLFSSKVFSWVALTTIAFRRCCVQKMLFVSDLFSGLIQLCTQPFGTICMMKQVQMPTSTWCQLKR